MNSQQITNAIFKSTKLSVKQLTVHLAHNVHLNVINNLWYNFSIASLK